MTRTTNSLINLMVAMVGQIIALMVSFVARIFFLRILGTEYMGINGLFNNILTMLSLVELGIGPAIVYSLYAPLAENNIGKVRALLQLYKKTYTIIGVVIAVIGICMTPYLDFFIKETSNIPNLRLIFMLFVINSSISYFFSYKRNLIIADQHRYIITIYDYSFFIILNILQIIFLNTTKNYIVFLLLQIASTIGSNIAAAKRADKMYPFMKQESHEKLDSGTLQEIKRNTGAMVMHRVGSSIVNSLDNIIISMKVGIIWVGLYSNYLLIINALIIIIGQYFTAITASVGNLGATESKEKSLSIFQNTLFANFWICGVTAISLFYLFNPFISLWLGKGLLMSMDIVAILVVNYYLKGMKKSVFAFRDAFGVFWYDRYEPIVETLIYIAVAISLAPRIGISGVFIGSFVSTIATCFWIEPYVLYKHGFNASLKPYFLKHAIYTFAVIIAGIVTGVCVNTINGTDISAFLGKVLICLLVPNLLFLIFFHKTKEFRYSLSILKIIRSKIMKK